MSNSTNAPNCDAEVGLNVNELHDPALVIAGPSPTLIAIQFCNFSALAVFYQQELNTSTLARRHTWTP